ncbi:hypothetical protein OV079_51485 [Nannocystis pusilla]|uniref:Uncharacterized protein n=1 Tax=Nannocystis pusilla TaxID=889268 RepID=A0A9X3J4F0_9BACT|nr:hypothetical protein [Nannocystis pusilla]MCY1013814.1 hypothetical protein [Nannocystis pusilla]
MLSFSDDFDTREAWAREIVAAREGNAPIAELWYQAGIAEVRRYEDAARNRSSGRWSNHRSAALRGRGARIVAKWLHSAQASHSRSACASA